MTTSGEEHETDPPPQRPDVSFESFASCIRHSDAYRKGDRTQRDARTEYVDGSLTRLHRIWRNLLASDIALRGPTLDVASGWGILFPAFRRDLPQCLPYSVAEMLVFGLDYDGVAIPCVKFECEKDTLPFPDASFGLVMFLDCLEHLVVDPMWPLLEFNRVLRKDGHLVTATPNAIGAFRIANILAGENPATEHHIKPASIYQRHNREWTPDEVALAVQAAGFRAEAYSTNADALSVDEQRLLRDLQKLQRLRRPLEDHGPELLVIARKVEDRSLLTTTQPDLRWPTWLYTSFDAYRRRPKTFPVVVGDDYA